MCTADGRDHQAGSGGRCQLHSKLGPGEGEGGPSVTSRQRTALPRRVSPQSVESGSPTHASYPVCGWGGCPREPPELRRVSWSSWSLNRVPTGWGESCSFHPARPARSLRLSHESACGVCLLLLPLHVVSSCAPCGAPGCPPLSHLLPFRAWRCLGCRGRHVWLCLFIDSKVVLVGTDLMGVRQLRPQLSPENCPRSLGMNNTCT